MARPRIVVEDATGELINSERAVTFGVRTGCDVVLDDAIAAARHCEFRHDGAFRVRDLGSVTGTWLDGKLVAGAAEVTDGASIVLGTSRLLAKIESDGGAPTLKLQLQRNAFWWRKPGKKVFDNDPDALVRAEVGFGRFPALATGNRVAMIVAAVLLLGGTFLASIMEPLADAGPLVPSHAIVTGDEALDATHERFKKCRTVADAQGCNVCHTTGAGAPASKCLQCHDELTNELTRRHPFFGGPELADLPGIAGGEQFCVACHTDHQGADWLKRDYYDAVAGKCDACHGELTTQQRDDLIAKAKPVAVDERQRPYSTIRFPHDQHVARGIDCRVCHRPDSAVQERRSRGLRDDPLGDDFAEVPYETCAACHVPGAPAAGLTPAQLALRPAETARWNVAWHGSDAEGAKCGQCHAKSQRGEREVFGPEMKTVVRPQFTVEQQAAERGRYTADRRSHKDEFAAHANGRECKQCHVRGAITPGPAARPFWHALHLAPESLQPPPAERGPVSNNVTLGCASCHQDMLAQKGLTNASERAYHWPTTAKEQSYCTSTCHREPDRGLTLTATSTTIAPERRTVAETSPADFPHDVHVGNPAFGKSGTLQPGCFACHDFARPAGGKDFEWVPTTTAEAKSCLPCHAGHADIGGGQCQKCHPAEKDRSNSFWASAGLAPGTVVRTKTVPPPPTRLWPGANEFSHLSRGHADVECAECHKSADFATANSLALVPVPDESKPATATACRKCHLEKQFHWR